MVISDPFTRFPLLRAYSSGRVLVGVGVGLSSSVLPIYLAEISPAKYRGRIVASLVVLITGGTRAYSLPLSRFTRSSA